MRVSVDRSRCTGHGRCYVLAPQVFEPDDDGYCTTDVAEVPADLEDQALRGAANCPEDAITVGEGPAGGQGGQGGQAGQGDSGG